MPCPGDPATPGAATVLRGPGLRGLAAKMGRDGMPAPQHESRQQSGDDQPDEPEQGTVTDGIKAEQQAELGGGAAEHRDYCNPTEPPDREIGVAVADVQQ